MKSEKDIKKDPFEEYLRESEPTRRESVYYWQTAIGLQAVDGLETSDYLKETAKNSIEGSISIEKAQELIESYYRENPKSSDSRTEEADKVSARIAAVLAEKAFTFSPTQYFLNLKLEKAKDYLSNTHLSCKEIAFRLGFDSTAYFNKMFRQRNNITPQEFRGQLTQK